MFERRRFSRTKVFKGAKLMLADRPGVPCIVCNLSSHGACLQLQSSAEQPKAFDLSFDNGRTLRKCRIVWQTLTNVGVCFDQTAAC